MVMLCRAALAKTLGKQDAADSSDLGGPGPGPDEATGSPRIAANKGDAEPAAELSQVPKPAARTSLVLSKLRKYAETPLVSCPVHIAGSGRLSWWSRCCCQGPADCTLALATAYARGSMCECCLHEPASGDAGACVEAVAVVVLPAAQCLSGPLMAAQSGLTTLSLRMCLSHCQRASPSVH